MVRLSKCEKTLDLLVIWAEAPESLTHGEEADVEKQAILPDLA